MNTLTWYKGIILGLIQGATEFFPVSSSAHLVIAQTYLGIKDPAKTLAAFDVTLHLGTLVAAVIYFRWDLLRLFACWIKPWREKLDQKNPPGFLDSQTARRMGPLVLLGIVPAGIFGALFKRFFEDLFSDIFMVSIFLLITGAVINATRRIQGRGVVGFENMNFKQVLIVGLAQVVSILPGISRSGTTISAGLFVKLKPAVAFRYSFLMMIPIVAGAVVLDLGEFQNFQLQTLVAALLGAVTAGVTGFYCIGIMFKWMTEGKFANFAYYCWAVGGFMLIKELFF